MSSTKSPPPSIQPLMGVRVSQGRVLSFISSPPCWVQLCPYWAPDFQHLRTGVVFSGWSTSSLLSAASHRVWFHIPAPSRRPPLSTFFQSRPLVGVAPEPKSSRVWVDERRESRAVTPVLAREQTSTKAPRSRSFPDSCVTALARNRKSFLLAVFCHVTFVLLAEDLEDKGWGGSPCAICSEFSRGRSGPWFTFLISFISVLALTWFISLKIIPFKGACPLWTVASRNLSRPSLLNLLTLSLHLHCSLRDLSPGRAPSVPSSSFWDTWSTPPVKGFSSVADVSKWLAFSCISLLGACGTPYTPYQMPS